MSPSPDLLDKLVGSYPDLDPANPSSYILISTDRRKAKPHLAEICAASLRSQDQKLYDEMLLACPKRDEQSLAYINWLINHPFKQFKDIITLNQHGVRQAEGDAEACFEYYIHVLDLDKFPANAFYNFCIATRAPIEFEATLNMWSKLIGLGLTPGLANIIAGLAAVKLDDYRYVEPSLDTNLEMVGPQHIGHWWLNSSSSWEQVLAGNMTGLTESYKAGGQCTPAADIWGFQKSHLTYDYFKKYTLQQLLEKFPHES